MPDPDPLDRWLDGDADPATLARWLAEDPARPRELLRRARFRRDLADLVKAEAARRPLPGHRRGAWAAMAAAAVLAVAGAWIWIAAGPGSAPPRWRGGPAAGELVAAPGDALEWSDGSRIEPGPGTRLRAGGDGRIDLLDGRIVAEVEPRRDPFAIHAGGILVEVLGTRFAVEAGASTAAVQVERGRVAVAGGGGRLELGPGGVAWLGSGRLAAGPTAAWSVRPDAGWTGEPVAEGMATVVKPEDSLRFGGTVRWIASPEAAAGHATLDTAGTLVLELGAAEAVTVSVTMVLAPAAAPAAWRGNLQRELRVPAGGGVFRLPVAGFAPIAGEAPAGRFATVLRRLTLTIGGGPAGLVLRRAALEPGRL